MQELPKSVDGFTQYMRIVKGRSEKTIFQYRQDLLMFFRWLYAVDNGIDFGSDEFNKPDIRVFDDDYLRTITKETVMRFLYYTAMERENGTAARARKLSSLKSYFKYLELQCHTIDQNPAMNIDTPKKKTSLPKYLTLDESISLLEAVQNDEESRHRERDYCIITLFLNCGMRLSELTGINRSDIDPNFKSLVVTGKGNKERIIYLNEACRDAIKAYLPHRARDGEPKDKDALFISREHRRISNQMVQKTVEKYLGKAGLTNRQFSTHKLRHTAATLMYQSGKVDVRALKEILGHEQLNTTQIYTHVSSDSLQNAMEQNPLARLKKN